MKRTAWKVLPVLALGAALTLIAPTAATAGEVNTPPRTCSSPRTVYATAKHTAGGATHLFWGAGWYAIYKTPGRYTSYSPYRSVSRVNLTANGSFESWSTGCAL